MTNAELMKILTIFHRQLTVVNVDFWMRRHNAGLPFTNEEFIQYTEENNFVNDVLFEVPTDFSITAHEKLDPKIAKLKSIKRKRDKAKRK